MANVLQKTLSEVSRDPSHIYLSKDWDTHTHTQGDTFCIANELGLLWKPTYFWINPAHLVLHTSSQKSMKNQFWSGFTQSTVKVFGEQREWVTPVCFACVENSPLKDPFSCDCRHSLTSSTPPYTYESFCNKHPHQTAVMVASALSQVFFTLTP